MKIANALMAMGAAALFAGSATAAPTLTFTQTGSNVGPGFDVFEVSATGLDSIDLVFSGVNNEKVFGQGAATSDNFFLSGFGLDLSIDSHFLFANADVVAAIPAYESPTAGLGDLGTAASEVGGSAVFTSGNAFAQLVVPHLTLGSYSGTVALAGDTTPVSGTFGVPEPASLALLGLGGLAMIRRR